MTLEQRIRSVQEQVTQAALAAGRDPASVTLCAATKVQTDDTIRQAIARGIAVCGENRVQELTAHLEADAYAGAKEVHFIGHLQTNKVKFVVGKVDLIQSVDSQRLLAAIDRQAEKVGVVQKVLLEVNIGLEESKGGCLPQDLPALVDLAAGLNHIKLCGLMAIPPVSTQPGANRPYFSAMRQLYVDIFGEMTDNQGTNTYLSMGMSADFADAIAEGASLVRVGTALFGPRPPMGQPR